MYYLLLFFIKPSSPHQNHLLKPNNWDCIESPSLVLEIFFGASMLVVELPRSAAMRDVPELFLSPVILVVELPRRAPIMDVPEGFFSAEMLVLLFPRSALIIDVFELFLSPEMLVLLFPLIALIKEVPENLLTGSSVVVEVATDPLDSPIFGLIVAGVPEKRRESEILVSEIFLIRETSLSAFTS